MNNNTATKKQYRFQTIVATGETRQAFSALRDSLNSSDKELMEVLFELSQQNLEQVVKLVEGKQAAKIAQRTEKTAAKKAIAEEKRAAKKAASVKKTAKKASKKTAKKVSKKRATKKVDEQCQIISDDEGDILVVNGL